MTPVPHDRLVAHIRLLANLVGYDLTPLEPRTDKIAVAEPELAALAEAGYMPLPEYIAAVTARPGFDGRDNSSLEKET